MADITRTAADVSPANDILAFRIQAGTDVEAGQPVYVHSDGKGYLADGSAAASSRARGLAAAAIRSGQWGDLVCWGKMTGFSGMTPGGQVYVSDTEGELSDAAGSNSWVVGFALTATEIMVTLA